MPDSGPPDSGPTDDKRAIDALPDDAFFVLHQAITAVLAEADRLDLRMVGIHLCCALQSLEEGLAEGTTQH